MKIDVKKILATVRANSEMLKREMQARIGWLSMMGIPEEQLEMEAARLVFVAAVDNPGLREMARTHAYLLDRDQRLAMRRKEALG